MDCVIFFFQAEDGIRDLVRSRGLGDVYKRQDIHRAGAGDQPPDLVLVLSTKRTMVLNAIRAVSCQSVVPLCLVFRRVFAPRQ